ncbi:MAG: alkaline phosphatase family protein [Ktedonobacteraceae bacterium]
MRSFQHRRMPVLCQRMSNIVLLPLVFSLVTAFLASCGPTQGQSPNKEDGNIPAFSHIFTIVMENKEYTKIIGDNQAPYLNSLARSYAVATNYYAITHPSLPNYLALTGGETFGVSHDCIKCFQQASNLPDGIEASGRSWKGYMESMPTPCYIGNSPDGLYMQKHDPFLYYDDIRTNRSRCATHVVPFTQFSTDLAANQLPNYVWITPNMCHDMHNCSIAVGDKWLSEVVPSILHSNAFTDNGVLFITFDEGRSDAGCCGNAHGGQVITLVISPLVKKGWQSSSPETHYSLLRTIETAWGLPHLGNAAESTGMAEYFSA